MDLQNLELSQLLLIQLEVALFKHPTICGLKAHDSRRVTNPEIQSL